MENYFDLNVIQVMNITGEFSVDFYYLFVILWLPAIILIEVENFLQILMTK